MSNYMIWVIILLIILSVALILVGVNATQLTLEDYLGVEEDE